MAKTTQRRAGVRSADALAALSAVLLGAFVAAGVTGWARVLFALVFIFFVPGWAATGWMRRLDPLSRLAIAVGISLSACILAAAAALALRLWNPSATLAVLDSGSVILLIARQLTRPRRAAKPPIAPPVEPVWVGEVELSRPFHAEPVLQPPAAMHRSALLLVRLHGVPVGFTSAPLLDGRVDLRSLSEQVATDCWGAIAAHLAADGAPVASSVMLDRRAEDVRRGFGSRCPQRLATPTLPISVVLCTRNRPELVRGALDHLSKLDYPDFEVLLVDNAPSDDSTRRVFDEHVGGDPRFRYVVEPRPGLSRARNRGLDEARCGVVAFTDDDASADAGWLEGIARGFASDPTVGCVTGLVPSAQLDTPAQHYFHDRVWWASSLEPRLYRPERGDDDSPLHPFRMGVFGTGANFAIDRELALRLGGFSELLGAGSPCRGGAEDGDMFVRVLRSGRSLRFEPSAIIWHRARPSDDELRAQLEEYGRGIPITGMKWLIDPALRRDVLRRAPAAGLYYASLLWKRGYAGDAARAPMALCELRGTLFGPVAFFRGYRSLRREQRLAR